MEEERAELRAEREAFRLIVDHTMQTVQSLQRQQQHQHAQHGPPPPHGQAAAPGRGGPGAYPRQPPLPLHQMRPGQAGMRPLALPPQAAQMRPPAGQQAYGGRGPAPPFGSMVQHYQQQYQQYLVPGQQQFQQGQAPPGWSLPGQQGAGYGSALQAQQVLLLQAQQAQQQVGPRLPSILGRALCYTRRQVLTVAFHRLQAYPPQMPMGQPRPAGAAMRPHAAPGRPPLPLPGMLRPEPVRAPGPRPAAPASGLPPMAAFLGVGVREGRAAAPARPPALPSSVGPLRCCLAALTSACPSPDSCRTSSR